MKYKMLAAFMVAFSFFALAGNAFASSQHSLYGQCGPAVHNGSQLVNAWGAMNVLNTSAASTIAKSAGWKPMDGGMVSFITQRGREFKLAKPANVKDFGCKVGTMFSVGTRHYGAGESVIGIVPVKYNPNQISGSSHKGYHKITIWVRTVGRGSCANGFQALVPVIAYVPNTPAKPAPKKPKAPAPKPAPTPTPAPTGSCNVNNSPGAVVCSTFYVFVTCGGAQVTINGSTKEEAIANAKAYSDSHDCNTVVVTPPPPCNCTPPTPTCQPPYTGTYPNCVPPACPAGYTGTYPSCTPPPANVAPSCNNVTSPQNGPNGVYADGETYPGHVTITSKSGESLVVTFSSTYGSFTNGPIAFTSNGVDVKDWVYRAPNDAAIVGKSDQITVTVTNTKTGLSSTCSSQPFILNASPPQV